ncbi:hypothetical protein B0H16DRAFT_319001 [Mycena metata]|uniref:F-box domain-containing protein n=1 Tax=Mycena metata TaxID=1033252 RepID=A0AAD7JNE9_9AGAR|nr:hypothetical protein B0H16DRAFT_319001 [Mycena metata]
MVSSTPMSTATLRRRLVELEVSILAQRQLLDDLERDKEAVEAELRKTSTFPVSTLPVEITAEFFLLSLPTIEDLRDNRRRSLKDVFQRQAPRVFLSVCRRWRDIALTTPVLWASLHLSTSSLRDGALKQGKIEEFIEQWFNRAALRPLSFAFHASRTEDDDFADGLFTPTRLRDVVHRYASRLEYLELDIAQHELRQLNLDSVMFPLLQRVALGDQYGPEPDSLNPVVVFGQAPRLCGLEILAEYGATLAYYSPPWQNLTKFEGEIDNLALFTLASNLLDARIAIEYLEEVPDPPISHPTLRSLALVTSWQGTKPVDLLKYLELPALQSLHVSEVDNIEDSFFSFLERSSPPLQTLSMGGTVELSEWQECLLLVNPTLENLELDSPSNEIQRSILTCHRLPSVQTVLPRLQSLVFKNIHGMNYWDLVDFLDGRMISPRFATPRSFRAVCSNGTSLEDTTGGPYASQDTVTDRLTRLGERGIDINIQTEHNQLLSSGHRVCFSTTS